MANPNINAATSVLANNSMTSLDSANATLIVSNPASSGAIYLVDSLHVANTNGTVNADVSLAMYDTADDSGNATPFASTIVVPADATLVAVSKDSGLNVKENQSIYATANAGGNLTVLCCWKEIS